MEPPGYLISDKQIAQPMLEVTHDDPGLVEIGFVGYYYSRTTKPLCITRGFGRYMLGFGYCW